MLSRATFLTLALSVLVGTSIPFVPTGEMVSGAAALGAGSLPTAGLVLLIAWLCSVGGDTTLMLVARRFGAPLQSRLLRHRFGRQVTAAQQKLQGNAGAALVTARLIPGGRAPVIVALGLSRFPVRRFVAIDVGACAAWAAIFTAVGAVGATLAADPWWGMGLAVVIAVSLGLLVPRVAGLVRRRLADAKSPTVG